MSSRTTRRLLAFALHATAATIMAWGWLSLTMTNRLPKGLVGGRFLFLTNQGLAIAWLCMVVSVFNDVFPSIKVARTTKRALLALSLPIAFVVSTIYWTLKLRFPDLIVPSKDSALVQLGRIPFTTDLALHALPFVALLIDFLVFEPEFSKKYSRKAAPIAVVVFSIWYASLVEYCATYNGFFPYPFLTFSPFPRRVLIYTAVAGIALGCFRILNALHP